MTRFFIIVFWMYAVIAGKAQACLTDTSTWRVTPTADNATIVIPLTANPRLNDNTPLPSGTLIGAFNANQQLCGMATWTGTQNIALTVYGFEQGSAGFNAGEWMRFRIKLPNNVLLMEVQVGYATGGIYTTQGNYASDGISGMTSLVAAYPTQLQGNVQRTAIRCYGGTGSLAALPSGGTPPYRYAWTGGTTSSDSVLNNVRVGNYRLEITDSRNCKMSLDTSLAQPDSLRLLDTISAVRCYGGSDGQIRLGITGGTVPYTYAWNSGNGRNVRAGTYQTTVTDANGCQKMASFSVTQPDSLRLTTTATPSVVGQATGTARVMVAGGVSPYRYVWSRGDTTAFIQQLAANAYTATVTDANGCTKTVTVAIITNALRDAWTDKCAIYFYPNPVRNGLLQVRIDWKVATSMRLQLHLCDALGRRVSPMMDFDYNNSSRSVSVEYLPKGIYFAVFELGTEQWVQTVVIAE